MVATVNENLNHDDPTVEVTDYVNWNNRLRVAISLLGGWVNLGGFITYVPPASYVYIPSLVCKNVTTSWKGDIDPVTNDWKTAEIGVSYGKYETQVVDFGEISIDVSADSLAIPGGSFQWSTGPDSGKKLGDNDITPQVVIPGVTIRLKRLAPFLYLSPIVSMIGKINSSDLFVAGFGFAAESVLFAGAQATRKITSEGNELWEYDFSFVARPFSWNQFFHKSGSVHYVAPQIYGGANLAFFFT